MVSILNDETFHANRIVSMQLIYNKKKYLADYGNLGLKQDLIERNFDRLKKSELLVLDGTEMVESKKEDNSFDYNFFIFTR